MCVLCVCVREGLRRRDGERGLIRVRPPDEAAERGLRAARRTHSHPEALTAHLAGAQGKDGAKVLSQGRAEKISKLGGRVGAQTKVDGLKISKMPKK